MSKSLDKANDVQVIHQEKPPDLFNMKTSMVRVMHDRLMRLSGEILDSVDTETTEGRKTTLDFLKVYASLAPKQSQNENLNHNSKELSDEEALAELRAIRAENSRMLAEQRKAKQARIAHQAEVDEAREAEFEPITRTESLTAAARPRTEEELSQRDS